MRKRITIALFAALLPLLASGQNDISALIGNLESHRVSLSYSCTVKLDVPMKSQGKLIAQQNCYKLSSAGLDIYCDGTSRWTVDNSSKEVYIESSPGIKEFLGNSREYLDKLSDVKLSDVTIGPADTDTSIFTFDEKSLDSGWIVTDLR